MILSINKYRDDNFRSKICHFAIIASSDVG